MNVENWAKFRYAINIGTDPCHLQGNSISEEVKSAFRELGKGHYEVVCSLGYCNLTLLDLMLGSPFVFHKAVKDFYFHGGVLLDNISRLIFIINIPNAASDKDKNGALMRHKIDRSSLANNYSKHITSYIPHISNPLIIEFTSLRNAFAHYWRIPMINGQWPRDQLRDKALAWHNEPQFKIYSNWQDIIAIMKEHFEELKRSQDAIFGKLLKDIAKFESCYGVSII
jgi:hypothetical protein